MSDAALIEHIRALPDSMKEKVARYVAGLEQELEPKKKITERQLGGLKGAFEMSPDFDDPMEEFKDYM